jgi:hypothetical protein
MIDFAAPRGTGARQIKLGKDAGFVNAGGIG